MDDDSGDSGGTTWADVFGNITSALAPAIGAAAGMYVSKELRQVSKNTGVAIPRGTTVPGPYGAVPVPTAPGMLSSLSPYLLPLGLAAVAVLLLKRK